MTGHRIKLLLVRLLGVAIALVAVSPWLRVVAPADGRVVVLGAVLAATAVALGATLVVKVRASTELAISGTLLLVFLLVAVVRDPLGFVEVARGLRDGVPRILSTTLPILDVRWAAVPAAVVAWSAGGLITSLLARTRSVAGPLGIAFVTFVGGYAITLGGASGDPSLASVRSAAVLGVLACALAALRAPKLALRDRWQRVVGRGVVAAGIVVTSALVAVLVVDRIPYLAEEPIQPRISAQASTREPTSPTLAVRRLRGDEPDRVVTTVTADRPWSGYVPIAVLSDYDGRVWGIGRDRFDPTGGLLPVDLPVGDGPLVTFRDVDVDALGGWLPFVARAAAIEGASILHNGGGAFQLAEGDGSIGYRLRLSQPSRTLTDTDVSEDTAVVTGSATSISVPTSTSDRRPAGERICRFLALSRDPAAEPSIDGVACGGRSPGDVAFLRALSDELRAGRAIQEDLIGGDQLESGSEALYDLLDLVGTSPGDAAVGTPEQFASAYALMADDFGIPVRVVTGFRVEAPAVGEPVSIEGAHAWTWVEVPVDGVGWVVIDPSPSAQDAVEQEDLEELRGTEAPPDVVEEERTLVGVDPSRSIGAPPPVEEQPARWWLLLLVLPALPLAVVSVTLARRWVRRRRRRHGDARVRAVGAWHELLDRAYDAGIDVESLSGDEVADGIVEVAPWLADPLAELVTAANRAVFSSRPVDDRESGRCWEIVSAVRRDLRRTTSRRQRARALLLPPPPEVTHTVRPAPLALPAQAGQRRVASRESV